MKFRERFMNHEAEFDELFTLTDEWSFSDETCTLREYLGLTAEEEDVWISESDEALETLLEQERQAQAKGVSHE
jgi:hypothetical protein